MAYKHYKNDFKKVKVSWSDMKIRICPACFERECYKIFYDPNKYGHDTDCKNTCDCEIEMFGKLTKTTAQCCCYGHPDGDY